MEAGRPRYFPRIKNSSKRPGALLCAGVSRRESGVGTAPRPFHHSPVGPGAVTGPGLLEGLRDELMQLGERQVGVAAVDPPAERGPEDRDRVPGA